MTIDNKTTCTTKQIALLTGLSKQRLGQLEGEGAVARIDRDAWPLVATVKAVLAHANRATRAKALADQELRVMTARADAAELRLQQQRNELVRPDVVRAEILSELGPFFDDLSGAPARIGGRDLEIRRRAETVLVEARNNFAAGQRRHIDRLKGTDDD
jgi:hypothetical protein